MNENLRDQLDFGSLELRLQAVEALRKLEREGKLDSSQPIGPVLPSYDHIHSTASYGPAAPGVFSVSHMIWAAHEAGAFSTVMVEHESTAHFEEATRALSLVNEGMAQPLRLVLAVEFKAPIDMSQEEARRFGDQIGKAWGQSEAAWVVGVGATPNPELSELVRQFQEAKRIRAELQLEKLNSYLKLKPPLHLTSLVTRDGNITDRSLSWAVAKAQRPELDDAALARHASVIRKMLNPGGPGYASFPKGLPSYQELIQQLAHLGMTPTFTAQFRGDTLESFLPLLKSWGISGLDVAGIEPDEPNAEQHIQHFIELATRHNLALFGGSDYRGTGTGWTRHSPWMEHPLIRSTVASFTGSPSAVG